MPLSHPESEAEIGHLLDDIARSNPVRREALDLLVLAARRRRRSSPEILALLRRALGEPPLTGWQDNGAMIGPVTEPRRCP